LRLYGFFDVGNVFGSRAEGLSDEQYKAQKKLRASVGLGVSVDLAARPAAPRLRFPDQVPEGSGGSGTGLVTIPKDRIQRLQFQIGTSF
jgi:outer membrane protein insertion porin family